MRTPAHTRMAGKQSLLLRMRERCSVLQSPFLAIPVNLFLKCFVMVQEVARLIGASAKEIIFTSGATESNNTAIKGVASFYSKKKRHIITTQTEHKCVLDSCRALQEKGFDVTSVFFLPIQKKKYLHTNKKPQTG